MRGPQPWRTNRARVLRSARARAEARIWAKLRNRQLGGYKFVRQAPIGPHYVDFACREQRVVVEIDGATHGDDAQLKADAEREQALAKLGYRVFRATNHDVYTNLDGVLDTLLAFLTEDEV